MTSVETSDGAILWKWKYTILLQKTKDKSWKRFLLPKWRNVHVFTRKVLNEHWRNCTSMGITLVRKHRNAENSPTAFGCNWSVTVPCLKDLQIYGMSVYLFKRKCLSFSCECVTVEQSCLVRETLIYETWHQLWLNYLRCPGPWHLNSPALQEPSFIPDRCVGCGFYLQTQFIFHLLPFAGLRINTSVEFYWNALKASLSLSGTATFVKSQICLVKKKKLCIFIYLPCYDNASLPPTTITGQCWACAKRWCHPAASPRSLLCNQTHCVTVHSQMLKGVCACVIMLLVCKFYRSFTVCLYKEIVLQQFKPAWGFRHRRLVVCDHLAGALTML